MAEVRHGGPVEEPPQDVFLSDDPAVGMVRADMGAWLRAHPCDCEALCECDAGPQSLTEGDSGLARTRHAPSSLSEDRRDDVDA